MSDEKPYVLYMKFKSGEEVISEAAILEDDGDQVGDFFLTKPMAILGFLDTEVDPPKKVLYMQPWLPVGVVKTHSTEVYIEDMIMYTEVAPSFIPHYVSAVEEMKDDMSDYTEDEEEQRKPEKIGENVFSLGVKKKEPKKTDPEESK
jgi:hypothetical protein